METNIVPSMPQSISRFDPDDQWVVMVDKEFILNGKEAELLKKASEEGYRGLVWFSKFAISIAHIKYILKNRSGKVYREQLNGNPPTTD